MKKVLIPLEIHKINSENSEIILEGTPPPYLKKLIQYNLLPIIASHLMTKEMLDTLYQEADGLYLTGGADWNPKLYKEEQHPKTDPKESERDLLEMYFLKKALKDKKPILAICRGAQGLTIAGGGTLHQHIPDVFPTEDHSHPKGSTYKTLLTTNKKHPVNIKKGTKTYALLQEETVMVNSFHHQAAKKLGKDFIASGTSPQGVIEVIEHKDPKFFCIGIQSHPEVEKNSFFEKIFIEFAKNL